MYVSYSTEQSLLHINKEGEVFHDKASKGVYNLKNAIVLGRKKRIPLKAGEWDKIEYYKELIDHFIPFGFIVICTEDEILKTSMTGRESLEVITKKGFEMYVIPRGHFVFAEVKGINA